MNTNETKFIGHEQAKGDNSYPIGTEVRLYGWPTGAKVIGHHEGQPIIQPEPSIISDDQIFSSKTGPPRIIL